MPRENDPRYDEETLDTATSPVLRDNSMKRQLSSRRMIVTIPLGFLALVSTFTLHPVQALLQAQDGSQRDGTKTQEDDQKTAESQSVKPGINKEFLSRELDVDQFMKRFEVESREVYANRQALTKLLEIQPGMAIADIGSGTGAYLNLFAEGVGEQGKVYAVDLAPNFLAHLKERVHQAGWKHVEVVECDEKQVGLGANLLDRAYICDTYHHFEYPMSTMTSLHKAMKKGGMLVVVDFDREPGKSREWILTHVRAGKLDFRAEIEAAGFEFIDEPRLEALEENYVMRFRK
jgi:ubiquinone/menaquinone biosynthesis C-methylase UbiE